MKVLFLDIDGVLNNETTKDKIEQGPFEGFLSVDRRLAKLYMDWLEGKDIYVVLSSTWRNHPEMTDELIRKGIYWKEATPRIGYRGAEIDAWLNNAVGVEAYAILDDVQQFTSKQRPYFVKTSYVKGLTPKNLKKVEKILNLNDRL